MFAIRDVYCSFLMCDVFIYTYNIRCLHLTINRDQFAALIIKRSLFCLSSSAFKCQVRENMFVVCTKCGYTAMQIMHNRMCTRICVLQRETENSR